MICKVLKTSTPHRQIPDGRDTNKVGSRNTSSGYVDWKKVRQEDSHLQTWRIPLKGLNSFALAEMSLWMAFQALSALSFSHYCYL